MDYELIISERADELTERLTSYLLNNLKNRDAAAHFLDELDSVYDRLINTPPHTRDFSHELGGFLLLFFNAHGIIFV